MRPIWSKVSLAYVHGLAADALRTSMSTNTCLDALSNNRRRTRESRVRCTRRRVDRIDNGGFMFDGDNQLLNQILVSFILSIFIVTGLVGVALGVGLNVSRIRTLSFLKTMNRWFSVRTSLKTLAVPHDIDKAIYRKQRWFGVAFAIGGAFTIFMMLFEGKFPYVVAALSKTATPLIVQLLVESLRWLLLMGGVLASVIGFMMLASSSALPALEARLNHWISSRKLGKSMDEMHMTLDNLIETFPRTSGALLALGSAMILIAAMIVWLGT